MTFTKMYNGTPFRALTEIILRELQGSSACIRTAGSGTFYYQSLFFFSSVAPAQENVKSE